MFKICNEIRMFSLNIENDNTECLNWFNKYKIKVRIIDRIPMNAREVAGFEIVNEFLYLGYY